MTKELQDLAWSVLPKEFKEETIRIYNLLVSYYNADNESGTRNKSSSCYGKIMLLRQLFGYNNLTSDVEGEEMLTVKASVAKDIYNSMNKAHPKESAWVVKQTLEALFGSKCLLVEKDLETHQSN